MGKSTTPRLNHFSPAAQRMFAEITNFCDIFPDDWEDRLYGIICAIAETRDAREGAVLPQVESTPAIPDPVPGLSH